MAQGHLHPSTALHPRSSGQPPWTFLLPAVPCLAMHPLPGPCLQEVGSYLAPWVPALRTRGAGGAACRDWDEFIVAVAAAAW